MTGAPKIRAMELIAELETEPRGVYCGAIGHISPKREAFFNVAIRSPVVFRDATGEMGIGSGVVFDLEGAKEYAECLLKMKFLTDPPKPFELIETMLYEPGSGFWLLDRHLARLESSARYFGYAYDAGAVTAALTREIAGKEHERLRVRLTLAENGGADRHLGPAAAPAARCKHDLRHFGNARLERRPVPVPQDDAARALRRRMEALQRDARCRRGALSQRARRAGRGQPHHDLHRARRAPLDPPLAAGLLPGTLRAELLATGRALEAVLTRTDLDEADAVYLGNSVRGLLRAEPLRPCAAGTAAAPA